VQVCNLLRKLGASTAVRKTESATALPGITPSHTAACCVYGYAGGHMLAARTEVIHRLIAVIFSRYAYAAFLWARKLVITRWEIPLSEFTLWNDHIQNVNK